MHVPKHQLYLLEQQSEPFKIWSALIRINTEGNSLITKLAPGVFTNVGHARELHLHLYCTVQNHYDKNDILRDD